MAKEYIVQKDYNNIGIIGLSTAVFESIVALSIDDIENVSLVIPSSFQKNVTCKVENNQILINMSLIIKADQNINEICQKVQDHVLTSLKQMTDYSNFVINIDVKGFYI